MPLRAAAATMVPRTALGRVLAALAIGLAAGVLGSLRFSVPIAALGGWNLGGLCLCAMPWVDILGCNAEQTRRRAAAEDPGRGAVYAVVTISSIVSLFAATVLSRRAALVAPPEAGLLLGLCLLTVALAWTITHTSFTLRYAHLYYREEGDGGGGVKFPDGSKPSYSDFAYLSFTVGMCFQVSDVDITSRLMRQTVLLHAVISFTYNTAILAFALNLIFGASSG